MKYVNSVYLKLAKNIWIWYTYGY